MLSFSASRYAGSTFGEMIERGLKQVELAEAVGVTEMTVVSWERRTTLPRTCSRILHACQFLGIEILPE